MRRDAYVDPRSLPTPPWRGPARKPAASHSDVEPLKEALSAGRLYDAEAWVASGMPLQFRQPADRIRTRATPLQAAVSCGNYDGVHLLLCNGYRMTLERRSPLTTALRVRRLDIVRLLLEWGADVQSADSNEVVRCYDVATLEMFWRRGFDFARDKALAYEVASGTRNRPLYGFLKRHAREDPALQRELDRGLCYAVQLGSRPGADSGAKAVQLCMWAGADPWHLVEYRWGESVEAEGLHSVSASAAGHAVLHDNLRLLALLRLSGSAPRFQELYELVRDVRTLDVLVAIAPPRDLDELAVNCIANVAMLCDLGNGRDTTLLRRLLGLGGRVRTISDVTVRRLRDGFRKHPEFGREIVSLLQRREHAERAVLLRLIASPAILKSHLNFCVHQSSLRELIEWPEAPAPARAAARRALKQPLSPEQRWEDD